VVRMLHMHWCKYASQNASLFTGAKEATFHYFSKRKSVCSWFILKSSDILHGSLFCTSNSLLVFHFALSRASVFVTNHRRIRTRTSYISCPRWLLPMTVSGTERKVYSFKYGHFSYKNTFIHYRRPVFTSRSRVRQATQYRVHNRMRFICDYERDIT
ncbi:hypothetical protein M9458_053863, partial [Cirrhinus mrigala]